MASIPEGIMRSVEISRNNADEVSLMLFIVHAALDFDLAFGIGIAFIGMMRWPLMKLRLIHRVANLIWEDASTQGNKKSLNPKLMS